MGQKLGLEAALGQSHPRVTESAADRPCAEADRLAKDLFNRARARQVQGDRLQDSKDLVGAARVYDDASERHVAAIRRAEAVRAGKW